jgi:hemoglobin-like flavoprotein
LEHERHVAAHGGLVFDDEDFLCHVDPALRPLFKNDIEEQSHKLLDMLGILIALLERPGGLDMELRAMGARHAGYGVRDTHYATVGIALLGMLEEVLGDAFTSEVRTAWTQLYEAVAAAMRRGAAETALRPAVHAAGSPPL